MKTQQFQLVITIDTTALLRIWPVKDSKGWTRSPADRDPSGTYPADVYNMCRTPHLVHPMSTQVPNHRTYHWILNVAQFQLRTKCFQPSFSLNTQNVTLQADYI